MFGSTKKKHIYDSYSMPLFIDNDKYKQYESNSSESDRTPWPSLVQQTVSSSIVQNRNIATDLIDNFINGVFTKSRAFYSYGRRGENPDIEGGYLRGLPTGKSVHIPAGSVDQVKLRIQKETGRLIYVHSMVLDEEDDGYLWYEVTYYFLDKHAKIEGDLQTWLYREADETYPELTIPNKDEDAASPYYPIIPIREYNDRISETDPELFRTGRHALKLMGIKYEDLDSSVHDDENVDLGFLDHCYVLMAVDIATKVPNSNLYLFDYFKKLHKESQTTREDYLYWLNVTSQVDPDVPTATPPPPPTNRIEVSDGNYKMVMGWIFSERTIKTGVVTDLNHVNKFIAEGDDTTYTNYDFSNDVLVLQKQFTDSQYEEIVFHGLTHTNYIGTRGKTIRTKLSKAFTRDTDEDKNNFIIPIRIDVIRQLGSIKGHDLIYDSMRIVFNSHKTQKVKWYQTGIFKALVVVVAIAISMWNAPAGTTLLTTAMAGIVATTFAVTVAIMAIAPLAIKTLQDLLGPEFALVVTIAAIYITAGGSITATTHLNAATTAVGGAKQIEVENTLAEIQKELELLEEGADEIQQLRAEEADRISNTAWATRMVDETSHHLKSPNNFIKAKKLEPSIAIDLAGITHRYTDQMQFLDRPYSDIKLGLKPYQG